MPYYFDPLWPREGFRAVADVILDTLSIHKLGHNIRKSVVYTYTQHRHYIPMSLTAENITQSNLNFLSIIQLTTVLVN